MVTNLYNILAFWQPALSKLPETLLKSEEAWKLVRSPCDSHLLWGRTALITIAGLGFIFMDFKSKGAFSEIKAVATLVMIGAYQTCEEWRTHHAIQQAAVGLFKTADKQVDRSLMNYMRLEWIIAEELKAEDLKKTALYPIKGGKEALLTLFQAIAEPSTQKEEALGKRNWIDEMFVLRSIMKQPGAWSKPDFIKLAQNQPLQAARLIFYYGLVSFEDWTADECAQLWNVAKWRELKDSLIEKKIDFKIEQYCFAQGFSALIEQSKYEMVKYLLENQKIKLSDAQQLEYGKKVIDKGDVEMAEIFKKNGFPLNLSADL